MEEDNTDANQVEDGENRRKSLRKRRVSQVQQEEVKTVKDFKKRRKVDDDIKNIYLNKNFKEVKPQALETIFETCKKVKNTEVWMSTMKYRRFCKFTSYHAVPKDKVKLRKDRARRMKNQFGTKIPTGKISQDLLIDILNCISDEENDPDVKSRLELQEKKENLPIPYKDEKIQPDMNGMELVISNLCSLNMQSPNHDHSNEKVLFAEEDAEIECVPRKARKGRRKSGNIKDHLGIELFRNENRLEKKLGEELSSFHEMPKISKIISRSSELSDIETKEPQPVLESPSKLPMFITHSTKKRNVKNQRQPYKRGKRRVSGIQRQLYLSSVLESPETSPSSSQSPSSCKDIVSVPKSSSAAPVSPSRLLATLSINSPKQCAVTSCTVEGESMSGAPCLQPDLPHVWPHGLLEKNSRVRNVPELVQEPNLALPVPQGRQAAETSQELTPKSGKTKMDGVQRRRRSNIHNIDVTRKNCLNEQQQLPVTLSQHGIEGSDPSVSEPNVAAPLSRPTVNMHQVQQTTPKAPEPKRKIQRRRQSDIHNTKKTFMAEQQQALPHACHQRRAGVFNPPEHPQTTTVPISEVDNAVEGSSSLQVPTSDGSMKDQTKQRGLILISDFKDCDNSPIISGMFRNQASVKKGKLYKHISAVS